MKRMLLVIALVSLGAGLGLAQDSSLVREPAVPTPPTEMVHPAAPMAPIMLPSPKTRERRFGAGFRFSVLDKASFFVAGTPHRLIQLELGGYGTRRKSEGSYQYTYRAQAEADVLFLQGNQNRLFAGLRYSWERSRDERQYEEDLDFPPYGTTTTKQSTTMLISRIGLSMGVDIATGRIGLQFGMTPLYDQRKTITDHYQSVNQYSPYVTRDTAMTNTENETVMDFKNIFAAMRVMF